MSIQTTKHITLQHLLNNRVYYQRAGDQKFDIGITYLMHFIQTSLCMQLFLSFYQLLPTSNQKPLSKLTKLSPLSQCVQICIVTNQVFDICTIITVPMSYRKDIQLICYDQLNIIVSERDEKNKNIWIYNTVYIIHIA